MLRSGAYPDVVEWEGESLGDLEAVIAGEQVAVHRCDDGRWRYSTRTLHGCGVIDGKQLHAGKSELYEQGYIVRTDIGKQIMRCCC